MSRISAHWVVIHMGKKRKKTKTEKKSPHPRSCWKHTGVALRLITISLVIAAAAAAYSNSIHNSFHYDDLSSIRDNLSIRTLDPGRVWTENNRLRFLHFYSLAINYRLGGLKELRGWHYVNISIHITCALLIYAVLSLLSNLRRPPHRAVAVSAALLFAVHPMLSEPVNYIQARHAMLPCMFSLTGVLCTIGLVRAGNASRRVLYALGIAASIGLGRITKEVGIFYVPAACAAYVLLFLPAERKLPVNARRVLAGAAAAALVLLAAATNSVIAFRAVFRQGYYLHLLTQAEVFWRYASMVFPSAARLNVEHDVRLVSAADPDRALMAWIALLGILLAAAAAVFLRRRKPVLAFLATWAVIGGLPYLFAASGPQLIMVEYKAYMPAVGFIGIAVLTLDGVIALFTRRRLPAHNRAMALAMAVLVLVCIGQTRARNRVWEDETSLWTDAVEKSPLKAKPYANRGIARVAAGDLSGGMEDYNRALELDPGYALTYFNRANAHMRMKKYGRALADFDSCIAISPRYGRAYANRGATHLLSADYEKARADLTKAIALLPRYACAEAYNSRGAAYRKLGKTDEAITDFTEAIGIDPDLVVAYTNRAFAYRIAGEHARAEADFARARELGAVIIP